MSHADDQHAASGADEGPQVFLPQKAEAGWSLSRRNLLGLSSLAVLGALVVAGCGGGGGHSGGGTSTSTQGPSIVTLNCGDTIPQGYVCTCNCVSRGVETGQNITREGEKAVTIITKS